MKQKYFAKQSVFRGFLSRGHGVKGLNGVNFSFILLNSHVMRPHKTKSKSFPSSRNAAESQLKKETTIG